MASAMRSLAEELFSEASSMMPELRRAKVKDAEGIAELAQCAYDRGFFYSERARTSVFIRPEYDLRDPRFVRKLIRSRNDTVAVTGDKISAFSHWGPDREHGVHMSNHYTIVGESGKGVGRRMYEAFLTPISERGMDFTTEFIASNALSKIYPTWERFGTLPMAFLVGAYENNVNTIFSSVVGGRIKSMKPTKVYVPKAAEDFTRGMMELHGMEYELHAIDSPREGRIDMGGPHTIMPFHEKREIEWRHTRLGLIVSGVIPNRGIVMSPLKHGIGGLDHAIKACDSAKLNDSFKLFKEYLRNSGAWWI